MNRPDDYEWWIDSIQDCMCQIAGRFDSINPKSNACRHVCDETYEDLSHFVDCVRNNGYCNVPDDTWQLILKLSESDDLESNDCKSAASAVLESAYFRDRKRWQYDA